MKLLLADDLWPDIAKRAAKHIRLRAAIAYVTANYLEFGEGDVLVCDASDSAIQGGLTSAHRLQTFFHRGAQVYSFTGLHSKIAVIDDFAIVGSANLSANAGVRTCEATLLTDDLQVVALAMAFIEKVKLDAEPVTEKFLQRILRLPVVKRYPISRGRTKRITVGESRVWFVATHELSRRLIESEAAFEAIGMGEARKRARRHAYEMDSIRLSGKSRFRLQAKSGDVVIVAHTWRRGKRKYTQVYDPAPIVYRQETKRWTRLYLEYPVDASIYHWREITADFRSLGVTSIRRTSTRELKGQSLGILHLLSAAD